MITASCWLRIRIALFVVLAVVAASWMVGRVTPLGVATLALLLVLIGWDLSFIRFGRHDDAMPLWAGIALLFPHSLIAPAGLSLFISLISLPVPWPLVGACVIALVLAVLPSRYARARGLGR